MTIAIAATGPQAGLAVVRGLQAAEAVGTGSIGGFAALAVITAEGRLQRYATQRGGSRTLFIDGETTGVEPPAAVRGAIAAALISSGPDRPTPLSQFLAADARGGLVTAHRVPQGPSVSGLPLNVAVLAELLAGKTAQAATASVLAANPTADVGFITIDRQGNLYLQNAPRVERRPDVGSAWRQAGAAQLAVLHNAIQPQGSLAALVADIGWRQMVDPDPIIGWFTITADIPVVYGEVDAVELDDQGVAQRVITCDRSFTVGTRSGVAIYLHSQVRQGGRVLGKTLVEPICTVQDGQLVEMSGQRQLRLGYVAGGG